MTKRWHLFFALAMFVSAANAATSDAALDAAREVVSDADNRSYAADIGIPSYLVDAKYILEKFGIPAGTDAVVSQSLHVLVPEGMRMLLQPHADAFLRHAGVKRPLRSQAVAIPFDETQRYDRSALINALGIVFIKVEEAGHVDTRPETIVDPAELLDRYKSAVSRAVESGTAVVNVSWVTPPTFDSRRHALTRSARVVTRQSDQKTAMELAAVDLLGRTSVATLSLIAPSEQEAGDDKPMQLLRKLADGTEFATGHEYGAFHAEQDTLSKKSINDLVAPEPVGFFASAWGVVKDLRLATYLYMLAAACGLAALLWTKRLASQEHRIQAHGIDAVGHFVHVEWSPGDQRQYLHFAVEVQLPDGTTATQKHGMHFSNEDAKILKASIAVGQPCYVKLDPKKHTRIVLAERWHEGEE